MSDIGAVLRDAFAAESAEHLQAIEPYLVGLDGAGPGEIADLFRGFHSLKGLAGAMGRYGMEAVAHQAESVLGRVRDHGAPVTEAMVDALLAATDALRAGRDATLAGEPDRLPPETLVARLTAVLVQASGPDLPAQELQAPTAAEGFAQDSGLGSDDDMLALFAEVLQGGLPELGMVLTRGEAGRAGVVETIERLAHAAAVMDMDALVEAFDGVARVVSATVLPPDAAGRLAVLAALRGVADKVVLLEELLGIDAGAATLRAALEAGAGPRPAAGPALGPLLAGLARAIRGGDGVEAAAAQAEAALAEAALAEAALAHPEGAGADTRALVALLGDVLPRLRHGTLAASPALAVALERLSSDTLEERHAADHAALLRDALADPDGLPADTGMSGPLMDCLTAEARGQVVTALEAGQQAYALVLFLEDAPLVASGLLAWLRNAGSLPGSRSVFHGSESWLEILLLSSLGPDLLVAGLLQADPDRLCLRELRRLLASGDMPVQLGIAGEAAVTPVRGPTPAGELRVSGAAIDRFMDGIAEARASLAALTDVLDQLRVVAAEPGARGQAHGQTRDEAHDQARDQAHDQAREQAGRLDTQLRLLHGTAIDVRIVPIDLAFNRLPRVVRTLAREQGKAVELQLEGRDVRIDKAIVDRLIEPMLHMVRNAIDHGLEQPDERVRAGKPRRAVLLIRAVQGVGEVRITIGDDGRGLDRERILARAAERGMIPGGAVPSDEAVHRLIFQPGFSTAAGVTETSGRGVGMDVVLTEVRRLGGEVTIDTQPGQGTRFTLRLPLTAATLSVLLVRVAGQCLGVPEAAVAHVLEVPRDALLPVDGRPAVRFGAQVVPVRPLAAVLWPGDPAASQPGGQPGGRPGAQPGGQPGDPMSVPELARLVIVSSGGAMVALEVDEIMRRQELLLLRLHPALADCPCLGGAAVLGNGEVVLSLDTEQLVGAALAETWHAAA